MYIVLENSSKSDTPNYTVFGSFKSIPEARKAIKADAMQYVDDWAIEDLNGSDWGNQYTIAKVVSVLRVQPKASVSIILKNEK